MLLLRRVLIIGLILTSLVMLEANASDTLLINLPSDEEVIKSIEDKRKQEEQLQEQLTGEKGRDQKEDYKTLFDMSVKHTFIIEFTQEEWDGLINDMVEYQQTYGSYKSNNYRNVTVTYIADDEIFTIENVGIRSKGNDYSRILPIDSEGNVREIHYMMKFNETFDREVGTSEYDELKKREVFNIEQLLFKRNNQGDTTYINEVFSYHMFREAGVVVPDATMAEVQIVIDGKVENVHLYNVFEHFDEEFIRQHFQEVPTKEVGDLWKVTWSGSLEPITDSSQYGIRNWETNKRPVYALETNKDLKNYDQLIDFTHDLSTPDTGLRYAWLQDNLDIESFIKAMAVNVLTGNPDDYRGHANNYFLYFDESGMMTYLPFDYDNSFGTGWTGTDNNLITGNGHCNYTLCNDIYEWAELPWVWWDIPLWDNVIEYEEYKIMYEDYMMEYIESGLFSEASYKEMFDQVNELYGEDHFMYYDKGYFINEKIRVVTEQVIYYRNERD